MQHISTIKNSATQKHKLFTNAAASLEGTQQWQRWTEPTTSTTFGVRGVLQGRALASKTLAFANDRNEAAILGLVTSQRKTKHARNRLS